MLESYFLLQLHVGIGCGTCHCNGELARFELPVVCYHVVIHERALRQSDAYGALLTRFQIDFLISFQFFLRSYDDLFVVDHVYLSHVGSRTLTRVLDVEAQADSLVGVGCCLDVAVLERGV